MNNCRIQSSFLLCASLVSAAASATQLTTTVITTTSYNSNVYASESGEQDDVILQFGPEFELRNDREGRLDYQLDYRGNYQAYLRESDVSSFEHWERLRLSYDFDPRTTLTLNQRYRNVTNLQFDRSDFDTGNTDLDIRENQYQRNDLGLDLRRDLSRRWTLNTMLDYQVVDFDDNVNRSDSDSLGAGVAVRYNLNQRHDLGMAFRVANQNFDPAPTRLGAESDYVSASVLWTFRISEGVQFEMEAGPTWIDATQDAASEAVAREFVGQFNGDQLLRANFSACSTGSGQSAPIASRCRYDNVNAPPIPAENLGANEDYPLDFTDVDRSDDDTAFFGSAVLSVDLADWQLAARYARRQSATSGEALATSLDELLLSLDYQRGSSRWHTYGELRWDRREALTEALAIDFTVVPGPANEAVRDEAFLTSAGAQTDRDGFTGLLGVAYGFNRQLIASLEARYRKSDRPDDFTSGSTADTYVIALSLQYDFEPRRF